MPPRIDPYANKTHRRIDITLILLAIVLIAFVFRFSAHSRSTADIKQTSAPFTQEK